MDYYTRMKGINMLDLIIRLLGGITKTDAELKREEFEKWATENLTGINDEVTPNVSYYSPFEGDDICVIRSNITIMNGLVKGINVAPWCKNVNIQNCRIKQDVYNGRI